MVFEKVQSIIADKLGMDESKISLESSLQEDLEADSLDVMDIITALEDEFEIEIPQEDLTDMTDILREVIEQTNK